MLIWINGPFGVGKTQTAFELHRRLPGSVVCDPEYVGFGLHRMLPSALRGDFQDLPAGRSSVHDLLDHTLQHYAGDVIVPMTLVEPSYFDEIITRLRSAGHDVWHFALLADRPLVLRRLRERGFGHLLAAVAGHDLGLRGETFAVANLDRCLEALARPMFAEQVWTDELTIAEGAARIAASAQLTLMADVDSRPRAWLRRAWVGARLIRFD